MGRVGLGALLAAASVTAAVATDEAPVRARLFDDPPTAREQVPSEDEQGAALDAFHAQEAAARAALRAAPGALAGASRASELTRTWTVLSFSVDGAVERGKTPTAWRARRIEGGAEGRTSDDVARSADCPALAKALAGLESVSAPRIDIPGVGEDWRARGIAVAADRASYRLWATSLTHGEAKEWASLDLEGAFNSPLADWMDAALQALAPCWKPSGAPTAAGASGAVPPSASGRRG